MRNGMKKSRLPMYITILTMVFLYIPLIMVVIASFNDSKYGGKWVGFSLRWYDRLFHSDSIFIYLANTLIIANIAMVISTILGTLAALALYHSRSRFKSIYYGLVYTPLVVPDILMGIGLLLVFLTIITYLGPIFFDLFGVEFELGMTTIIIAHVTFSMSYVTMIVLGRLQKFDSSLVEAAQDLGASSLYTFFHVTLPSIAPSILAGALFAFTLSIDDFVITFFVKGAGDTTLSVYIQSAIRRGTPALLNAMSVIFFVVTFILVFIVQKILSKTQETHT